jgi:adenylylsulfate reductase, subunit B
MPPVINPKKCKHCGKCGEVCQCDVFYGSRKGEMPLVTYPEECWHCNACVDVCPFKGAIRLRVSLPLMVLYRG